MNGLTSINVELTSRCNKECFMCGRRKLEKESPEKCSWGDMDFTMVQKIARQVPKGTTVQLHNNGEPLLYPRLGEAIKCFDHCITGLNTNAKLLTDKAAELAGLNSLTISIIPDDPEGEDQFLKVQSYLELEITKPPIIVFRILGGSEWLAEYFLLAKDHNITIAKRQLHAPGGSFQYEKPTTIPEMGICLEALHKLSIDRCGFVSPCVRFDPRGEHVIGDMQKQSLAAIWIGEARSQFIFEHLNNSRFLASPICASCAFWGVPR